MKEATQTDAVDIAHRLDVDKETVWRIIKGMRYSKSDDLAMAVHRAFLCTPARPNAPQEHEPGS